MSYHCIKELLPCLWAAVAFALLGAGKVVPVIDRCYPLSDTAEAMRYLGEGHARGKVVITVAHNS